MRHRISVSNFVCVPFFVCSIVMVDVRHGDFYLCIPLNILHQLMYNLACNKFPPGVAGVDRTNSAFDR